MALFPHAVGDGVLRVKARDARIADRVVVNDRRHRKISVGLDEVFPVDRPYRLVEVPDVAARRPQQGYENSMRRPEPEIEPHDVPHVTAHDDRVHRHLNGLVTHCLDFRLRPSGELLGARDDNRIILVCPDFHCLPFNFLSFRAALSARCRGPRVT